MVTPTLKEVSDFIDTQKNLLVTLILIGIGFYVTAHADTMLPDFARPWVDAAIYAAGVYTGHRIESGKAA